MRRALGWAEEEFAHIVAVSEQRASADHEWSQLKGVHSLRRPEQLGMAKELWQARDRIARTRDLAAGRVLGNAALVAIARELPRSRSDFTAIPGVPKRNPKAVERWMRVVQRARTVPRNDLPDPKRLRHRGVPNHRGWARIAPNADAALQAAKEAMAERAAELGMASEMLLRPASLRAVVWAAAEQGTVRDERSLIDELLAHDARGWQVHQVAEVLATALGLRR